MLRYSPWLTSFFTFGLSCHADRLCPCLHRGSEFNIAIDALEEAGREQVLPNHAQTFPRIALTLRKIFLLALREFHHFSEEDIHLFYSAIRKLHA